MNYTCDDIRLAQIVAASQNIETHKRIFTSAYLKMQFVQQLRREGKTVVGDIKYPEGIYEVRWLQLVVSS